MDSINRISLLLLCICIVSCAGQGRKLSNAIASNASVGVSIPSNGEVNTSSYTGQSQESAYEELSDAEKEIRELDPSGTYMLNSICVEAKFKNVAERCGFIELGFNISVPAVLMDRNWQLRMSPCLNMLGTDQRLDDIYISGEEYRNRQLQGYRKYNDYINSILADSSLSLRYRHLLEVYIERHEASPQAMEHYVRRLKKWFNDRKRERIPKAYARYVRNPFPEEGVRLDSVVLSDDGNAFTYHYTQSVRSSDKLKKIFLTIDGELWNSYRKLYELPESDTVTFYVSSLSTLADMIERYKDTVIFRNQSVSYDSRLVFASGSSVLEPERDNNEAELRDLKCRLAEFLSDSVFVVDSIIVNSFCSPEGPEQLNASLSRERGRQVCSLLGTYASFIKDSIMHSVWDISIGGESIGRNTALEDKVLAIEDRSNGEDWRGLIEELNRCDFTYERLVRSIESETLVQKRKEALASSAFYKDIKEKIFPALRRVRVSFHTHRRNMIADTLHTNVIDREYMEGLNALVERDYRTAIVKLRPYRDLNSALAFLSLDYNNSAKDILEHLNSSVKRDYLLAITYARLNEESKARTCLQRCLEKEPGMRFRANLDPELKGLVPIQ